ncbi:MAG: kinase-regulated stress-responsive transcription factor skn7 [Thelocarpon superellum]|nr:MAG: kinase-regulated stress-responsive transcription factor skn7 [Thelocarpon superellum]
MDSIALGAAAANANSSSDFVRKLYKMLEDPSYDQVVRWGNDGESFVVLENEKFTKAILPKHFKHSNFASFVRQLNKYDFHKVRHSNEEGGQSPYGASAWEFKHPEFKMNNKDSLDNIRRKAPAPRKSAPLGGEEPIQGTQQMDLVNSQLVAMQQQLQHLSDRYNELSMHHSMLLTEFLGVQKSLVNHEHVMENVMSYLHSTDHVIRGQRKGNKSLAAGFAAEKGTNLALHTAQQISPTDEAPPSPLQNADRILHDATVDTLMHNKTLEHMNELYRQTFTSTSPPDTTTLRNGTQPPSQAIPSGPHVAYPIKAEADLQEAVYPVGHNVGINPMYSEHINNIPYPMPVPNPLDATDPRATDYSDGRKKSTVTDPGWIRSPQILLVEDDPTCRRIGGKFLYSFKCSIDSALDGLEAVNKMNAGSKYDLVLMDIIMPNLDGISATSLIRQFDSTPIVAMTSNIRSDDINMYFQHGMNDVLPKPFTKEGLLTMLEKHLGHLKAPKDVDGLQPSPVTHGAPRAVLKDDGSSPATSNWHSPNPMPGVSPTSHTVHEDYLNALRNNPSFGVEGTMHSEGVAFHGQGHPMGAPRQGAHRRQASDMSGGDELSGAKRQRLYTSAVPNVSMAGMPLGRPVV